MVALLAVALAVGLAACGSSSKSSSSSSSSPSAPSGQPGKGKSLTLGAKNFTEEFILGQLYKQALEAKGFTVNLKNNIGSSEITDKAMTSGKIDLYPEYTGVIVQELKGNAAQQKSAEATYKEAKAWEAGRGFVLLTPSPFQDKDALAVLQPYAKKYGLKSVADLKKPKSFSFGAPPENRNRIAGVKGMEEQYGLHNIDFKPLTIGLQYQALNQGKIDVAAVFTTDGQLQASKYAVLTDPKGIFGFQNVAPVVNKKVLDEEGPAFQQTLNAVTAKLTTHAMQQMNAAVDLNKLDPKDVAQKFLQANGLS